MGLDFDDPKTPRGIRNRNPGNIRKSAIKWQGQIGNDGAFCIFDTAQDGIRALAKLLLNYQENDGCGTLRAIIGRYAPPSDDNDTVAYMAAVSSHMGVGPDDALALALTPSRLRLLIEAIIHHENGCQPYQGDILVAGIASAQKAPTVG